MDKVTILVKQVFHEYRNIVTYVKSLLIKRIIVDY